MTTLLKVTSMQKAKVIAMVVCLLLTTRIESAPLGVHKLAEVKLYDYGWQADMGVLDLLATAMQAETETVGYVIIYGGRRNIRGEVQRRIACMKEYMLTRRGFSADQIVFINGGYRTHATMEIWIASRGESKPLPTPTIDPKRVRERRGRIRYSCDA